MPNKIQDLFGQWIQFDCPTDGATFSIAVANRVWDTGTLTWVSETQPSGGGGAITIANGADATEGNTADAAVYGDNPGTISAKLRGMDALMQGLGTAVAPASSAVGPTDSVVIAANASRKKMVVINIGAVNVFFGDGYSAAMSSGIMLTPNGTWVMDRYTFTTNAIHAICASSSTLSIQEYQ